MSKLTLVYRATAEAASLRYVDRGEPGIVRVRKGKGFSYRDAAGRRVADAATLERIRRLAIPPAWRDVWICMDDRGHIQAVGRDARNRKQYRYHSSWAETRATMKYEHLAAFATALPAIRAQVDEDLALPGLSRRKVVAAAVRLLDETHIRVGNEEYARANGSFGLTSLRDEHVRICGAKVAIDFRGKSGKFHHVELSDKRLANVMRRCHDLPGQVLFRYKDDAGELHHLGSADVNDYLREVSASDITSKDFRTWAATVEAMRGLSAGEAFTLVKERKKHALAVLEQAAALLGNTVAVCRRSYVHPLVVEGYLAGTLRLTLELATRRKRHPGLSHDESTLLHLLEATARAASKEAARTRRPRRRAAPQPSIKAAAQRAPRAAPRRAA